MVEISVVTPCYNHGKYIPEMLGSVLNQTFQNFEVIIVNDGSTDDTRKILDGIHHEKVNIFHTKNFGPAHARNLAIKKARGEIIMNLDADDKIGPQFLEKCHDIFVKHPNAGIVYSDVEFFGAKTGPFILPVYSLDEMLQGNSIVANACFRRSDWKKTKGYSHAMTHGYEDFDFWLSIIELGRDVYQIKEPLVFYRTYLNPVESRSGRRKANSQKMKEAVVQAFQRHKKLYTKVPTAYEYFSRLENQLLSESLAIYKPKKTFGHFFQFIVSVIKGK
jgi:glycosyltransferase involved in cell wall biosynthesis